MASALNTTRYYGVFYTKRTTIYTNYTITNRTTDTWR